MRRGGALKQNVVAPTKRATALQRQSDERLWAEVFNLGGSEVLAKPFAEEEVKRVLGLGS